jgi:hypothetical protein
MLDEYVLVPDVFDPGAYSNPVLIDYLLPHLREPLFQEAIVSDLADGGWSQYCTTNSGSLHRLCKEFLKKLAQGNRLRKRTQVGDACPITASDWCNEGMGTAAVNSLTGIIAAHSTKDATAFKGQNQVASIERLTATPWWQARAPSIQLDRKTQSYLNVLQRTLAQANSLMFVDPYLDPSARGYREFHQLLTPLAQRNPKPRLELHRSFNKGVDQNITPGSAFWQQAFAGLGQQLEQQGLQAEVFIWSEFHDRHLITDVIGITASAGFDVSNRPDDLTTWSRMGRESKDAIQRQFDPATRPTCLRSRFNIGVAGGQRPVQH